MNIIGKMGLLSYFVPNPVQISGREGHFANSITSIPNAIKRSAMANMG